KRGQHPVASRAAVNTVEIGVSTSRREAHARQSGNRCRRIAGKIAVNNLVARRNTDRRTRRVNRLRAIRILGEGGTTQCHPEINQKSTLDVHDHHLTCCWKFIVARRWQSAQRRVCCLVYLFKGRESRTHS